MLRQGLMILNQLLLIVFLCVMNTIEATIPAENIVHIVLLTFLFWDGYNISGKNVKGNPPEPKSFKYSDSGVKITMDLRGAKRLEGKGTPRGFELLCLLHIPLQTQHQL